MEHYKTNKQLHANDYTTLKFVLEEYRRQNTVNLFHVRHIGYFLSVKRFAIYKILTIMPTL